MAIVLIVVGIVLLVIASLWLALSGKTQTEAAVGGFIGPIPFGFFTSKKAFWIWLALAALVVIFVLIWFLSKR